MFDYSAGGLASLISAWCDAFMGHAVTCTSSSRRLAKPIFKAPKVLRNVGVFETIYNRSRYRAETFLYRCDPRLSGKNLFHQKALHFRILVRAAIGDDNGAVVHVRCMA